TVSTEFWDLLNIRDLAQHMLQFSLSDALKHYPYALEASRTLLLIFLDDSEFPRIDDDYVEIYEALLYILREWHKLNEENISLAFRLAFAILHRDPGQIDTISKHFRDLLKRPIPSLEPQALDVLELLIEFGLEKEFLYDWYLQWASYLIDLPTARDPQYT